MVSVYFARPFSINRGLTLGKLVFVEKMQFIYNFNFSLLTPFNLTSENEIKQ